MPLNDAELAAYERSPDTFFGGPLKVGKTITSPFEWFEWFVETMKGVERDKMLKFFEKSPNLERLKQLSDEDLFYYYCERHTLAMTLKKVPRSPAEPEPSLT